jgi:hypothetical protein
MALSLARSRTAARSATATPGARHIRTTLLAPVRATAKDEQGGSLLGMLDAVGAALTRALFSPPSRDNASFGSGGLSAGFSGRLPARHGAARRPFADNGAMFVAASKGGGAAAASMSISLDEEEDEEMEQQHVDYLGGALGRVFGGQAGMRGGEPPSTGAGWTSEGAHRRSRRPGTGGGF